jgi:hypothetical protein
MMSTHTHGISHVTNTSRALCRHKLVLGGGGGRGWLAT